MKKVILLIFTVIMALIGLSSCNDHVHEFGEWTTTKNATCTESGERERYCACGEKQVQTIAATGHSVNIVPGVKATCTTDGTTDSSYCTVCGTTIMESHVIKAGHSFKDATCTEPKTCSVCGIIEGKELGHNYVDGVCTRCHKEFIPEIEMPSLPIEVGYVIGNQASLMTLTELSYSISKTGNGYSILFSFSGEKTFDNIQYYNGTYFVGFTYKLIDSEGYIVKSSTASVQSVSVGDKFRDKTFSIKIEGSIDTKYRLEISNYS